jgi:hypothetical protein
VCTLRLASVPLKNALQQASSPRSQQQQKESKKAWNVPEKDNCILPIGWRQDAPEIVRISGDAKTIDAVQLRAVDTLDKINLIRSGSQREAVAI